MTNPNSQEIPTPLQKYDVYGRICNTQAAASGTSDRKFVGALGQTSEAETGLIYMRARYYDPTLGRFIAEDPVRNGANWYVYCRNDPVGLSDATGKFPHLAAAIFVAGLVSGLMSIIHSEDPGLAFVTGFIAGVVTAAAGAYGGP